MHPFFSLPIHVGAVGLMGTPVHSTSVAPSTSGTVKSTMKIAPKLGFKPHRALLPVLVLLALTPGCSSGPSVANPGQQAADSKTLSMAEAIARNAGAMASSRGVEVAPADLVAAIDDAKLRPVDGWEVSDSAMVISTSCVALTWSSPEYTSTANVSLLPSATGVSAIAAAGPCLA